jgi:hypothetical protein
MTRVNRSLIKLQFFADVGCHVAKNDTCHYPIGPHGTYVANSGLAQNLFLKTDPYSSTRNDTK